MNFVTRLLLYYHTIKYLKFSQVYGRIWFKLKRVRVKDTGTPKQRKNPSNWQLPVKRPISMLAKNYFKFLNCSGRIETWRCWQEGKDRLWLYNLHYFDDLNAVNAHKRQSWHYGLISNWISDNPVGFGVGWEPYPISLRIVNWIKMQYLGTNLPHEAVHSLAMQARYLSKKLEFHILGNHLIANAKALVFAGTFFDGDEAKIWLHRGLDILGDQFDEQILSDGGHFERSPMYHSIVFEDLLDLLNLAQAFPLVFEQYELMINKWRNDALKMGVWLQIMMHPDKEISFFNDASTGVSAPPVQLLDYAARFGVSSKKDISNITYLNDSGYIRVSKGPAVLILDVGAVGPDYLPGHAHADTLSFELSIHGERILVNSGTSGYEIGAQRDWERSTAAHNTLEIDGKNSSEVWAGFRVARRAYPYSVFINEIGDEIVIEASHNGYRWLTNKPVHRRTWRLKSNSLTVFDMVLGSVEQVRSRVYFHPEVAVNMDTLTGTFKTSTSNGIFFVQAPRSELISSFWYPEFGLARKSRCLVLHGNSCRKNNEKTKLKLRLDF